MDEYGQNALYKCMHISKNKKTQGKANRVNMIKAHYTRQRKRNSYPLLGTTNVS